MGLPPLMSSAVTLADEIDSDTKLKQLVWKRAPFRGILMMKSGRVGGGPVAIQRFPYSDFRPKLQSKWSWWLRDVYLLSVLLNNM